MLSLHHIGSLQPGRRLESEDPLEEVWSRVSRVGIGEWLEFASRSSTPPISVPWDQWGPYAATRVRQAAEFRIASRRASLLTRPLLLYYCFLNLVRGFLAIETQ